MSIVTLFCTFLSNLQVKYNTQIRRCIVNIYGEIKAMLCKMKMPRQLSFAKFTVETCHHKLKNISSKHLLCNTNVCLSAIIYAKTLLLKAFLVKNMTTYQMDSKELYQQTVILTVCLLFVVNFLKKTSQTFNLLSKW